MHFLREWWFVHLVIPLHFCGWALFGAMEVLVLIELAIGNGTNWKIATGSWDAPLVHAETGSEFCLPKGRNMTVLFKTDPQTSWEESAYPFPWLLHPKSWTFCWWLCLWEDLSIICSFGLDVQLLIQFLLCPLFEKTMYWLLMPTLLEK